MMKFPLKSSKLKYWPFFVKLSREKLQLWAPGSADPGDQC